MARGWSLLVMVVLTVAGVEFVMMMGVAGGSCEYLSQITGGCPKLDDCIDTCSTCDSGVGMIRAECVGPGGGTVVIPFWECRCYFDDGAPCPPPSKPGDLPCPLPPADPPESSAFNTNRARARPSA